MMWKKRIPLICMILFQGLPCLTPGSIAAEPADNLEATIQVTSSVPAGRAIPIRITVRNKSTKMPVDIWPSDLYWRNLLWFGRTTLSVHVVKDDKRESLRTKPCLDRLGVIGRAYVKLPPGKRVSYTIELRQLFVFPADEVGEYHIRYACKGQLAEARFSISPPPKKRLDVVRFECKLTADDLYGAVVRPDKVRPQIRVYLAESDNGRQLLAYTTHRYSKGTVMLAEAGKELDALQVAHVFRPVGELRIPKPDEPPRVIAREYVGIAWLDDAKIVYTTYGTFRYSLYGVLKKYPPQLRVVPDFEQLRKPAPLAVGDKVAKLLNIDAAEDGYAAIHYRLADGTDKTIWVDEQAQYPCGAGRNKGAKNKVMKHQPENPMPVGGANRQPAIP